mgnify:CR=1 FL=1|tara:strand:- start:1075 stop:1698 length:624 start_codon:yes stop_codon:yes gene_type:complete
MAIISSYPTITPQLPDKLLGSNNVDSNGDPVIGNPTVQYTMTSVKTLIDQHYIQKLSSSNTTEIIPGISDTGIVLIFGAIDSANLDVTYATATGKVTFLTTGSYIVQQIYYAQATSGTNIQLNFKTVQDGTTQVGPTTTTSFLSNSSTARHRIDITSFVDITTSGTFYHFWIQNPSVAAAGSLKDQTIAAAWGTQTPSAQIIITKLV